MVQSPRLSLTYLAPQQAQKHVSVNETFRRLDALVQARAVSRTTIDEPASPNEGDAYILPAGKTGAAWSTFTDDGIAVFQDGAWAEISPIDGFIAFVADEGAHVRFANGGWSAFAGAASESAPQFGVNTAADAATRLAVKSDAALFSHDDATPGSGDARLKINKAGVARTASNLFQSNYSGRAEIGLTGDDDLHVKVSADGAVWADALVIAAATGESCFKKNVGMGEASNPEQVLHLASSAVYQPQILLEARYNGVAGGYWNTRKSRGGGPVAANDAIGTFNFQALDASSTVRNIASIAVTSGAPGGAFVPSRLSFQTTDSAGLFATRLYVAESGNVGVGKTNPVCALDIEGPARVKSYAKASLPSASAGAGQILYVSDEAGGATIAFSDGTNWRRVADRAVVS